MTVECSVICESLIQHHWEHCWAGVRAARIWNSEDELTCYREMSSWHGMTVSLQLWLPEPNQHKSESITVRKRHEFPILLEIQLAVHDGQFVAAELWVSFSSGEHSVKLKTSKTNKTTTNKETKKHKKLRTWGTDLRNRDTMGFNSTKYEWKTNTWIWDLIVIGKVSPWSHTSVHDPHLNILYH